MYHNALDDDFRVRIARLKRSLHQHDRGVLLGLAFSVIPIPPVAVVGLIIGVLNLRLLACRALPESERQLVRISLIAALASFVIGTALFVAIGWVVVHALSIKLPSFLSRLQELSNGFSPQPRRFAPGRGAQEI